jgi:hypothetical protein
MATLPDAGREPIEKCFSCMKLEHEVDRLSRILAGATTQVDAYGVLDWFHVGTQREQRAERAAGYLGRLSSRFDYWIFVDTMMLPGDEVLARAVAVEMSKRVDLLPRYLYAARYKMFRFFDRPDVTMATFHFESMLEVRNQLLELWDEEEIADYRPYCLLHLELAWAICGQEQRARGLSEANYKQRCREWIDWWDEYGAYCRFDEDTGHLMVDQDAMKRGQTLPVQLRKMPRIDRPQPGWCGPMPSLGVKFSREERRKPIVIRVRKSPYKEWSGGPCTCKPAAKRDES